MPWTEDDRDGCYMLQKADGHGIYAGWYRTVIIGHELIGEPFPTADAAGARAAEIPGEWDVLHVSGRPPHWVNTPLSERHTVPER